MSDIDPIVLSLIQNRLDNIAVQMGGVMLRTARSPIFSQAHDFSCFLTDAQGTLVSQADGIPIHSGGGGVAVRAMLAAFAGTVAPGDVYLSNDPYVAGGNHLPDWVLARPVFVGDTLVAFACIRAHQADIGGGVAGTYNPHATEIFQEGLRLPPLKLIEHGAELNPSGWAPLHYAMFSGSRDMTAVLITKGAKIDAPAPNGQTALMLAVKFGKLELVQLLVEAGAKKDLADPDGLTAIGLAKKQDHSDIVTYLRKAGAFE